MEQNCSQVLAAIGDDRPRVLLAAQARRGRRPAPPLHLTSGKASNSSPTQTPVNDHSPVQFQHWVQDRTPNSPSRGGSAVQK